MKKAALTILILLLMVNVVSACQNDGKDATIVSQLEALFTVFFFSSYALIIPISILYFLRKRVGLWTIFSGLISLVLFIPALFFAYFMNPCDELYVVIVFITEFLFMLFLFTFQVISWIKQRSKLKAELP